MSPRALPVALVAQLTRREDRWLRHSAERLRDRTRPLRRPSSTALDPRPRRGSDEEAGR
ncbi:hypothetical protein GCM10027270_32120 [Nocardioides ginkgobilobae]